LRANLADVILRMISLKLGDISEFPFIDRPDLKSIKDGFDLLFELGAIEQRAKGRGQRAEDRGQKSEVRSQKAEFGGRGVAYDGKSRGRVVLTEKGRMMAGIPLDPRLSRMLIEAKKEGCMEEICIIVAALSIQDPRERPVEEAREADRVHATFYDSQSDFVTLLNIWRRYHSHRQQVNSNNQMKRFCREHFLSYMRMREWRDIHRQISDILVEYGLTNADGGIRPPACRGHGGLRPGGKAASGPQGPAPRREGGLRPRGAIGAYAPEGIRSF
jgi:ATP-dependent helicase HrpA